MGVVVTLTLLASVGLAGAVVADVSQPTVTLSVDTISALSTYTILFQVTEAVPVTGEIVIEFPSDTTVPATFLDAEVRVDTTAGFGAFGMVPRAMADTRPARGVNRRETKW